MHRTAALLGVTASMALASPPASAEESTCTNCEIRRGSTVVAKGFEDRTGSGTGYSAACAKGDNGSGYVPYFFTKSADYTKEVKVYERNFPGSSSHAFTIKPNGDVTTKDGATVGSIQHTVGASKSSYTAWFTDSSGKKKGYAYWSLASAGLYDPSNKQIGTYGKSTDGDMRMLAFTFFYIVPKHCK